MFRYKMSELPALRSYADIELRNLFVDVWKISSLPIVTEIIFVGIIHHWTAHLGKNIVCCLSCLLYYKPGVNTRGHGFNWLPWLADVASLWFPDPTGTFCMSAPTTTRWYQRGRKKWRLSQLELTGLERVKTQYSLGRKGGRHPRKRVNIQWVLRYSNPRCIMGPFVS